MRTLLLIGCLMLVSLRPAETQLSLSGRWRAVLLNPEGGTQNIALELEAKGETVTGTLEGFAIREGRLDGSTLTLNVGLPNNQAATLTGQVSGDEIVFKGFMLILGGTPVYVAMRWYQARQARQAAAPATTPIETVPGALPSGAGD